MGPEISSLRDRVASGVASGFRAAGYVVSRLLSNEGAQTNASRVLQEIADGHAEVEMACARIVAKHGLDIVTVDDNLVIDLRDSGSAQFGASVLPELR